MDVKIIVCTENVHKKLVSAVDNAKIALKRDIKLFILGASDQSSSDDILKLLDKTDINNAPDPVILDSNELETQTAIIFWTSGTTGLDNEML